MTLEETRNLLSVLKANYPNSFKENIDMMNIMLKTWFEIFKNDNANEVYQATLAVISSDTSNFCPPIGRIKQKMNYRFLKNTTDVQDAWSTVLTNAKWNRQEAIVNFNKLPSNIKKAVGNPTFLEILGRADNEKQREYLRNEFTKNYKKIVDNDWEMLNSGELTRLEYCQKNNISYDVITNSIGTVLKIEGDAEND